MNSCFFSFSDINECDIITPTTCQNGASCEDTEGDYVCHCTMGFQGKQCQTGMMFLCKRLLAFSILLNFPIHFGRSDTC